MKMDNIRIKEKAEKDYLTNIFMLDCFIKKIDISTLTDSKIEKLLKKFIEDFKKRRGI